MLSTLNIPCDGKMCGQGRHVAGGSYICPHKNLKALHPTICEEWDPTNQRTPDQYLPKSDTIVNWICKNNWCGCHKWPAAIKNRVNGNGCPYCAHKKTCPHNSLKYLHPELCEEWDPTNTTTPDQYLPGSGVKVNWICRNNWCGCHKWPAAISDRTNGGGCPYCSHKAVCVHNSLKYLHPELAKEWDPNNVTTPDQYLPGSGAMVNWICRNNWCGCHKWPATINSRTSGSGCPYCLNQRICPHNNLKVLHPVICEEWDPTNTSRPEEYAPKSGVTVKWICRNNWCGCHKWTETINNRVGNNRGCPYCTSKRICPHNSLNAKYPELCKEWDPENTGTPDQYLSRSNIKVRWICINKPFHKWKATIDNRVGKYSDCPHCCASRSYSKAQIEWLNSIILKQNITLQYALSPDGEFLIYEIGKVDGYCRETNTVYEFHGDYWHGNPSIFHPNDMNEVNKKTFGELYQKTIDRDNKIRNLGYNLIVKWETPLEDEVNNLTVLIEELTIDSPSVYRFEGAPTFQLEIIPK